MSKKKKILIYYSSSQIAIDLISLIIELKKQNMEVLLLTAGTKGDLHNALEERGIETHSIDFKNSSYYYFKHIYYLAKFTKKHKIEIVYSHIQVNNFIASIAQYLSPAKFYMCRHHSDYVWKGEIQAAKVMDRITNLLAKKIVAISDKVESQLIDIEKVKKSKVVRINLGYDFQLYPKVNIEKSTQIKEKYNSEILLLNIGRLIPLKRQALLIEACSLAKKKGIKLKLIILGEGQEENNLKQLIKKLNLQNDVFLLGHVNNVLDYIDASDIIIHTSESEASSTIGKESAITSTPIMACKTVGDFDDYLNSKNGFLINKEISKEELSLEIKSLLIQKEIIQTKGDIFHNDIMNKFDIKHIIKQYQELFL